MMTRTDVLRGSLPVLLGLVLLYGCSDTGGPAAPSATLAEAPATFDPSGSGEPPAPPDGPRKSDVRPPSSSVRMTPASFDGLRSDIQDDPYEELRGRGVACRDGAVRTAPVGSFESNAFGLFDMLGNVWEWVADCWHGSYAGAPTSGEAWTYDGNCRSRMLRGGSWSGNARYLRSADRNSYRTSIRMINGGFRVARSLD